MTEERQEKSRVLRILRETRDVHGGAGSLLEELKKAVERQTGTAQGVSVGQRSHLMNKSAARKLRDLNTTHATCLDAKAGSSIGMGHRDESIYEALDPLCLHDWQDVLDACSVDYFETGEAFVEVVRAEGDPSLVLGLNHLESAQVFVEVEEEDRSDEFHYVVEGETGGAQTVVMARFGDLVDMKQRLGGDAGEQVFQVRGGDSRRSAVGGTIANSEVIHLRQSTNRSRYYGFPDYLSATPSIELVQCMTQHEFDFYFNRGVPEFLLFLIGQNVSDNAWDEIKELIKASQGLGQSHKTGAIQIPGSPENIKVQIERLGLEEASDGRFERNSNTLAMQIATAHGVPPILANILLPGRIGAANEGPNALMLFQKRKLGQAQRRFSRVLARTLGDERTRLNSVEGSPSKVSAEAFLGTRHGRVDEDGMPVFSQPGNGFRTVLDGMTLGAMDTVARMREPMADTARNPEDGLLGGADDRRPGDPRRTR